jgi:hypothetical protein
MISLHLEVFSPLPEELRRFMVMRIKILSKTERYDFFKGDQNFKNQRISNGKSQRGTEGYGEV